MSTALSGCPVGNPRHARINSIDTLLASLQENHRPPSPQTFANVGFQNNQSQWESPLHLYSSSQTPKERNRTGHPRPGSDGGPKIQYSPWLSESRCFSKGGSGTGWCMAFSARWKGSMSPVGTFPPEPLSQESWVDAAYSQQQSLPPVDVQNLSGIWVHVPPLIICGLHSLWPPLQKSNIPP